MKKYIILLIVITILIRIPFFVMVITHPLTPYTSHDSFGYDYIARNILMNHSYSIYLDNPLVKDPVRTPGYPLFLSLVYAIFPNKAIFVVIIQLLIDSAIVFLLFFFARTLLSIKAGIIAGFLYTFNIHQVTFATQVLTEILFTFFLLLSVFCFFLFIKKKIIPLLLLSGILIGVSITIRPIAMFFPLIPLFFLIKKKIVPRLIILFLFSLILLPLAWTIRNTVVFKSIFYTKIHAVNLVLYSAPSIIGDINDVSRNEAKEIFFDAVKIKYSLSDNEINNFDDNPLLCDKIAKDARRIILSYPLLFIKNQVLGVLHTIIPLNIGYTTDVFIGKGTGGSDLKPVYSLFFRHLLRGKVSKAIRLFVKERGEKIGLSIWILLIVMLVYQMTVYVLATVGIKKQRISSEMIFLTLTIAYFLVIPGEVGEARFRVPVEPFIALFASLAFLTRRHNG